MITIFGVYFLFDWVWVWGKTKHILILSHRIVDALKELKWYPKEKTRRGHGLMQTKCPTRDGAQIDKCENCTNSDWLFILI